jgi:hypothetical protein
MTDERNETETSLARMVSLAALRQSSFRSTGACRKALRRSA